MFNAQHLQEKWSPVLNHGEAPEIQDRYKRAVTSVLLENQERALREERGMLNEVAVNSLGASTVTLLVLLSLQTTPLVLLVSTPF